VKAHEQEEPRFKGHGLAQVLQQDPLLSNTHPHVQPLNCQAVTAPAGKQLLHMHYQHQSQVSFAAHGLQSVQCGQLLLLASPIRDSIQMNMLMMSCTGATTKEAALSRAPLWHATTVCSAKQVHPPNTGAPFTPQVIMV
jgi:hypothetical protein